MLKLRPLVVSVAILLATGGWCWPATLEAQPQAQEAALESLDATVVQVMQEWKVPGLALGIVRGGKVVLVKGYGWRDLPKRLPVTPKTLFAVGSITKSFTVTALGMLVDEGKLDWDKPVREYLPAFRLEDPVASERITPRDLVTHRSGLPRHDMLWYSSDFPREDVVRRLRYLEPNKDLRTTYQYNNLMFMTAGYLAGALSGKTWEEVVRERILAPLDMRDTNLSVLDSQKAEDFARPYKYAKGEVIEIPFYVQGAVGPAGEVNSCVDDLVRYLLFHLSLGMSGDRQLLSERNAREMQSPQMVIQGAPRYPELGESSYGMAWAINTYRGHKMVSHGGAIDGFTAHFSFMPRESLGVVVLTNLNADRNAVPTIVTYNVFDRLLGLDQIPWNRRLLSDVEKAEQSEEAAKKKGYTPRKPGTHPSHSPGEYAGEYQNAGYGTVTIAGDGDHLKMSFNRLTSPLEHFHYDVFRVPENPRDPLENRKVMFTMDLNGDLDGLVFPLDPNVKPVLFTRMAEKVMREKSFLEPLTGQYQIGAQTVTVSLQGGDTLILSISGQPARELVPRHGMVFDLKGLSGFSVEFKKDAAGKVIEAVFYQPNGTFVAERKPAPPR